MADVFEVVVKVGLNLRAGQRLIITNATSRGVPPDWRALVHEVAKAAYAAGARFVDVIWGDEEMLRIRLQDAPADSFTEKFGGLADAAPEGNATPMVSVSTLTKIALTGMLDSFVVEPGWFFEEY